ncbi:hypothetical protein [Chitinophaga sp. CF418]|uniref:hypothetical protein n=1 Tax=Chitinophaga sp. CF418 TaxID=1855287 RepID=UPI0009249DB4|nr:hypothetical protein [Chitinophaga sp. CF418]SHN43695.1 hypothetical protein SAMN05216311_11618 [Chitinophaga sp. CF418]
MHTHSHYRPGGKVILPAGSSINPASLSVLSVNEVSKVMDGQYKMDSLSPRNANDEALMMRYNYPGNENGDISAQSTAIALLMNMPAVQTLTEQAKLSLIKNIASSPDFTSLVGQISTNLMSGRELLDSTNKELLNAFIKLAVTASNLRRDGVFEQPILIHKAGNNVVFTNNGVAAYYWVGIYKDGNKITSFSIEAAKLISSSPQDFAMDAVDLFGGPPSVTYVLKENGEYQIYIRSGRKLDNLVESRLALVQN